MGRVFVCAHDDPPVPDTSDCPLNGEHTPTPRGYIAMSAWADRMLITHDQHECPGCGRPKIWKQREEAR